MGGREIDTAPGSSGASSAAPSAGTAADAGRPLADELEERLAILDAEVRKYGPRSVPGDLRHDHLLTCAALAFAREGFEQVSMQQIADMAGVTKPVIYGLFESKEELFVAVIDRTADELAVRVETAVAQRGASQLEPGVRAYLEHLQARSQLWGHLLNSSGSAVSRAVERMRDRQAEVVTAAILRGYEDLGLTADPRQAEALAQFIMGATDAVARWWSRRDDLSIDDIVAFVVAAAGPTLASIRSEDAPVWPPSPNAVEAGR